MTRFSFFAGLGVFAFAVWVSNAQGWIGARAIVAREAAASPPITQFHGSGIVDFKKGDKTESLEFDNILGAKDLASAKHDFEDEMRKTVASHGGEVTGLRMTVQPFRSHVIGDEPPPEPSRSDKVIARWWVSFRGRNEPDKQNQVIDLKPGEKGILVVHLPAGLADHFSCNLKHDKHNATDRGRTGTLKNGSVVDGSAEGWPAFGKRIYLGEQKGVDKITPYRQNGFYVDLVRQ